MKKKVSLFVVVFGMVICNFLFNQNHFNSNVFSLKEANATIYNDTREFQNVLLEHYAPTSGYYYVGEQTYQDWGCVDGGDLC